MPDYTNTTSKYYFRFIILGVILMVLYFLDIAIGSVNIPFGETINAIFTGSGSKPEWDIILFQLRLPKASTAVLAGFALSVSGLLMQTTFRNPLAGPYVLGISSGASLGVAVSIFGISFILPAYASVLTGPFGTVISACIGAGLIMVLLLAVSARIRDVMTILILGVLFGAATGSIVSILQYFSKSEDVKSFVIWTFGSLSGLDGNMVLYFAVTVFVGMLLAIIMIPDLDLLLIGERYAQSSGVNLKKSRVLIFSSVSLLAGAVSAFCGPIAFIGIAVPHITRLIFKTSSHKVLFFGVMLVGAILMLFSDIVSQLPGMSRTLPINSVTALIGIPVVIWVILKRYRFVS